MDEFAKLTKEASFRWEQLVTEKPALVEKKASHQNLCHPPIFVTLFSNSVFSCLLSVFSEFLKALRCIFYVS